MGVNKGIRIFVIFALVVASAIVMAVSDTRSVNAKDQEPPPTPAPTMAPAPATSECTRTPPCECPGRYCIRISDGP